MEIRCVATASLNIRLPSIDVESSAMNKKLIEQIDSHYNGGLTKWKKRYQVLLAKDSASKKALHIAASQLFESYQSGHSDALAILDKVIACTSANKCSQILCPACRVQRQTDASAKAISAFSQYQDHEIKFMTLLIRVEANASALSPLLSAFRTRLKNVLRNNVAALGVANQGFKLLGAFEVDLKNLGTQADASPRTQELVKKLGYNPKSIKSQYLLHLHAIVAGLDDERQDRLTKLIEKALGTKLHPFQLNFRSLHSNKSKNENLTNLARYMFKARLQFADNIHDDNLMQKQTRYHTPFKGKMLINYLNAVNAMGNFKGLKFSFGL
jgi:hypothetical protein